MSKSKKLEGKTGAPASQLKSVLKTLDFNRRFIDALILVPVTQTVSLRARSSSLFHRKLTVCVQIKTLPGVLPT
jgi:hypothetical protein